MGRAFYGTARPCKEQHREYHAELRVEHNIGVLSPQVPGDLHRDKLKKGFSIDGLIIICSTSVCVSLLGQKGCNQQKFDSVCSVL